MIFFNFGDRSNYQHCEAICHLKINAVTAFIHNNFSLELPLNFTIQADKTTSLDLVMEIQKWFYGVETYDHDVWGGGAIMQQQQAMDIACRNGVHVFSLRSEK